MEMIKKIMHAQQLLPVMPLPAQMQNIRVEVIVLPVVEAQEPFHATGNMKGCLKHYADPSLKEQEKNAWAMS
jgi:hypothetical protein